MTGAPNTSGAEWQNDEDEQPGLVPRLIHASGIALNAFKEAINPSEALCKDESCIYRKVMMHRLCDHEEFGRETDVYEVCKILGTVIKRDITSTAITFLTLLLTYTDRNQQIISFRADSSTGKSYIPLEILALFPEKDITKIAGASPTALIHSSDAEPVYEKFIASDGKEYERLKQYVLDMERKIMLFKDQPDQKLLIKMRSFLSKDEKESKFPITERTKSGTLRTKNIILIGYTTVVYCSAKFIGEEQENSRAFILSPEMTQEKLHDAIALIMEKETNYNIFRENIEKDPNRKWLAQRIGFVKEAHIREIELTPEDSEYLAEQFHKRTPNLAPRHTRDVPRLVALAKAHALLNYMRRSATDKAKPDIIEANRRDVDVALELYDQIAPSNELGIPPALLEWYEKVLVPLWEPGSKEVADRKAMLKKHREVYHRPLSRRKLEEDYLPGLENANLITGEPDPDDRRRIIYLPLSPNNAQHSVILPPPPITLPRAFLPKDLPNEWVDRS
jgi:hypothetical protein